MAKSSLRLLTEMTEMTEIVHANAASEVVSDFSMPSLVKVQNAGGVKKTPFLLLTHRFTYESRLFKALSPHYWSASLATSSRFRITHKFDSANNIACFAVFFTKPRKRTSVYPN